MGAGTSQPVRIAPSADRVAAAALAARSMNDNPLHVAALGPDPDRRVAVMDQAFRALLTAPSREVLGAWVGDRLVGVAAHTSSRYCQPGLGGLLRFLPAAVHAGRSAPRMLRWLRAWGRHDPGAPHSHLGPVAVTAAVRGQGVGGALLTRYVALLDDRGAAGYLETDRPANVRFYRRFGFEVLAEAEVLGVPNWFMLRSAASGGGRG